MFMGKKLPAKPLQNSEASRGRILAAALAEFSAYGLAGARVERIAKTAQCNKNLIYIYFENKETLFTTVLEKHLARIYKDVAFSADDLPGYASRVFDFAMANPDLMRLMAWFALEQRTISPAIHAETHSSKLTELADAQKAGKFGTAFSPAFLLNAIKALATSWAAANPFGLDLEDASDPGTVRSDILEAVRLLATAKARKR